MVLYIHVVAGLFSEKVHQGGWPCSWLYYSFVVNKKFECWWFSCVSCNKYIIFKNIITYLSCLICILSMFDEKNLQKHGRFVTSWQALASEIHQNILRAWTMPANCSTQTICHPRVDWPNSRLFTSIFLQFDIWKQCLSSKSSVTGCRFQKKSFRLRNWKRG